MTKPIPDIENLRTPHGRRESTVGAAAQAGAWHGSHREVAGACRKHHEPGTIDVKVVVQFIMRIDHATRLAIGSRERWETGLRAVERTGDQLRVRRPFQRSG